MFGGRNTKLREYIQQSWFIISSNSGRMLIFPNPVVLGVFHFSGVWLEGDVALPRYYLATLYCKVVYFHMPWSGGRSGWSAKALWSVPPLYIAIFCVPPFFDPGLIPIHHVSSDEYHSEYFKRKGQGPCIRSHVPSCRGCEICLTVLGEAEPGLNARWKKRISDYWLW